MPSKLLLNEFPNSSVDNIIDSEMISAEVVKLINNNKYTRSRERGKFHPDQPILTTTRYRCGGTFANIVYLSCISRPKKVLATYHSLVKNGILLFLKKDAPR